MNNNEIDKMLKYKLEMNNIKINLSFEYTEKNVTI